MKAVAIPGEREIAGPRGWLHTGDLAEIGRQIFIRGRLKDVLVLSNGSSPGRGARDLADAVFEQGILIGENDRS
jgi:acyl-CoA synthetase (AMP-forming)/AMP-acid ligase II